MCGNPRKIGWYKGDRITLQEKKFKEFADLEY
jgi:hypothetical protein